MIKNIETLVSEDRLKEALLHIISMSNNLVDKEISGQCLLTLSRLSNIEKQNNLNIIERQEYRIERTKICNTILILKSELENITQTNTDVFIESNEIKNKYIGNFYCEKPLSYGNWIFFLLGYEVPSYTIEFLTDTDSFKVNDYFIVFTPLIFIGREKKCPIRFAEFNSVGIVHAELSTRSTGKPGIGSTFWGTELCFHHLSSISPSFVNEKRVKAWYIQDGDIFQIGYNGPKMKYHNYPLRPINSLKLSYRIKMVYQQFIKPVNFKILFLLILFICSVYLYVINK